MNFEADDFRSGYWILTGEDAWWREPGRGATNYLNEAYIYSLEEIRALQQDGRITEASDLHFVPALPIPLLALDGMNDIAEHVSGRLEAWLIEQEKAKERKKAIV